MVRVDNQERCESLHVYRRRLIQETEMFLNWYLKTDRRSCDPDNGQHDGHQYAIQPDRTDSQPETESAQTNNQQSAHSHPVGVGTLVQVHGDDTGHVDEDHIEELILRMRNVSARHGDVMLDLSAVRSAPKKFLRVLDVLREQLSKQQRNLILDGIDHIRIYQFDR